MSIPKYKCRVCGKPVHDPPTKGSNMCMRCFNDERIRLNKERWKQENIDHPHFCVVCGKQFEWTPQTETPVSVSGNWYFTQKVNSENYARIPKGCKEFEFDQT